MTNKRWYQRVWVGLLAVISGLLFLGTFLDAVGNALGLISPGITYTGTALLLVSAGIAHAYLRKRPLVWIASDGVRTQISGLGIRPLWGIAGAILLLWLPSIIQGTPSAIPASSLASNASIPDHDGGGCYYDVIDGTEYSDSSEIAAVEELTSFLIDHEGGLVHLTLSLCRESVFENYDSLQNTSVLERVRLGDWRLRGLDLIIERPESGDALWNTGATSGVFQGYFVVLSVAPDAPQSEWMLASVRPIPIEQAVLGSTESRSKRARPNEHNARARGEGAIE